MAARDLPNLALRAFFALGEDGWKDDMDLNLLKLSVLAQATALNKVSETPAEPDPGDVYIFDETHPANANAVGVYDGDVGEEAWKFITPQEGWLIYNQTEERFEKFDGAEWVEFASGGGGGLPEAPADGNLYGRKDNAWAVIPDGAGVPIVSTVAAAASDLEAVQVGNYLRFTEAAAKTLTVRPETAEPLPDNGEWHLRNAGAADLTVVGGAGVTINPPGGGTLIIPQGGTVTLKRVAEDEFDLLGQTVPA